MSLKGKIEFHGLTDTGSVRDHNEDAISINSNLGLAVLADGMGGHRGGEVASAITVNTVIETASKQLKLLKDEAADDENEYSLESVVVHESVSMANAAVYKSSSENAQYQGMGTTVVVVLFYDNRFTVAHVGDSRLYRYRDSTLEQITRDHSLMQELIDRGFYTPEQAKKSLNKNLVTRAVGIQDVVEIDIQEDIAMTGDIYMMCSDGITDMIDDELVAEILANNINNLDKATAELIRAANEHGGKDNISVILARPLKAFPAKNSLFSKIFDLFS